MLWLGAYVKKFLPDSCQIPGVRHGPWAVALLTGEDTLKQATSMSHRRQSGSLVNGHICYTSIPPFAIFYIWELLFRHFLGTVICYFLYLGIYSAISYCIKCFLGNCIFRHLLFSIFGNCIFRHLLFSIFGNGIFRHFLMYKMFSVIGNCIFFRSHLLFSISTAFVGIVYSAICYLIYYFRGNGIFFPIVNARELLFRHLLFSIFGNGIFRHFLMGLYYIELLELCIPPFAIFYIWELCIPPFAFSVQN